MFIIPSYSHFLECRIYHYQCRLHEAKTVQEFNFLSEQLYGLKMELQAILN